MCLTARALEENGIATVILGSAQDILQYCGAPRFVFSDFPLGNPCGIPFHLDSQAALFATALRLLQDATKPGDQVQSNVEWPGDFDWKRNFMYVGPENSEELRIKGEERRAERAAMRARRDAGKNA
ncbi:MAG: hypothetical protein AAF387_06600 [Pseudomonadota bacterium]